LLAIHEISLFPQSPCTAIKAYPKRIRKKVKREKAKRKRRERPPARIKKGRRTPPFY